MDEFRVTIHVWKRPDWTDAEAMDVKAKVASTYQGVTSLQQKDEVTFYIPVKADGPMGALDSAVRAVDQVIGELNLDVTRVEASASWRTER